jgi:hypothetical protein
MKKITKKLKKINKRITFNEEKSEFELEENK